MKYPDVLAYYAYSWAVIIASPASDVSFMPHAEKRKPSRGGGFPFGVIRLLPNDFDFGQVYILEDPRQVVLKPPGDGDLTQTGATGKGFIPNKANRLGNNDGSEGTTAGKSIGPDISYALWNCDGREETAV